MANNIGDLQAKVKSRVQDGQPGASSNPASPKLTVTPPMTCDVDLCILAAREEYEKARPLRNVVALTGNGTKRYATTLLTRSLGGSPPASADFVQDSSEIIKIIYPFNLAIDDPDPLERDQFAVVLRATGLYLEFGDIQPSASQQFEVTFTTPHLVDAAHCTIPSADEEAFCDLAAAAACEKLASYYRQTGSASISADAVNYITKGQEYSAQAKVFRAAYKAKMNAAQDGPSGPAAAIGFFDSVMGNDVDRYFSHGRRFR